MHPYIPLCGAASESCNNHGSAGSRECVSQMRRLLYFKRLAQMFAALPVPNAAMRGLPLSLAPKTGVEGLFLLQRLLLQHKSGFNMFEWSPLHA